MKSLIRITLVFTILFTLLSCADKKNVDSKDREQVSLDAWVEQHVINQGINAERQENGMYIIYPETRQPSTGDDIIARSDWIKINYTGTSLDGRVFMLRDSMKAYREGTISAYAHYEPRYFHYGDEKYTGVPIGLHYALSKMRKGETCTLYLPSWLAKSPGILNTSNGFGGSYSYPTGMPIKMEVELTDIIGPNPMRYEEGVVKNYALNEWGLTDKDTIAANLYFHIEYDVNEDHGERLKINKEKELRLVYATYFLDGYLLETNDADLCYELIGNNENKIRRDTSRYANPYNLVPKNASEFFPKAVSSVFETDTLEYYSSFKVVCSSEHAYGATGRSESAPSTIVQPYTPLIYEVKILGRSDEEEDEDE